MWLDTNAKRYYTFHQMFQRTIKMKMVTTIHTNTTTEIDSKQAMHKIVIIHIKTET